MILPRPSFFDHSVLYYFKHPHGNGQKIPSKPLIEGHLDIKADGGLVAAPPSEGKQWVISPGDVEPAPLPPMSGFVLTLCTVVHSLNLKNSLSYKGSDTAQTLLPHFPKAAGAVHNSTLFTIAKYLRKGGASEAEAQQVLKIMAKNCTPPFTEAAALAKVASTYREQNEVETNLAERIREWVLVTPGDFRVTDIDNELGLVTPSDKNNRTKILSRLVADGLIERGGKRGQYRAIDRHEEIIDWENAEAGDGLPIKWPLELEGRFEVMPGSVVVVAGVSNAGKTAFVLNVARMNLESMPTYYFSSSNETNARTLRKRLAAFNEPLDVWKPMKAISRPGEFQDVIRPDSLNLIDYLAVHSDFYEIGGKIAAIAEKLNDGVAIIALQKNPGANFGRGGAMTMDKATAYISLERGCVEKQEPHVLKLPKVKYPLVDYADKDIRFKLAGGYRFVRA